MSYHVQVVYIYIKFCVYKYKTEDDEKEYDPDNLISQIRNFCYTFFFFCFSTFSGVKRRHFYIDSDIYMDVLYDVFYSPSGGVAFLKHKHGNFIGKT